MSLTASVVTTFTNLAALSTDFLTGSYDVMIRNSLAGFIDKKCGASTILVSAPPLVEPLSPAVPPHGQEFDPASTGGQRSASARARRKS